jgi:signal peptidase II
LNNPYLRFFFVVAVTVLLDQISKAIVLKFFPLYENLEVIPGFFSITHIRNTGGAFGLLAGQATGVRTFFFLGMSGLALGVVVYLHAKLAKGKPWVTVAFSLVFGGAVGNLIDRIRFGEVIDFLDFYVGTIHWPAFNVADSAITIGVGILCISVLRKKI